MVTCLKTEHMLRAAVLVGYQFVHDALATDCAHTRETPHGACGDAFRATGGELLQRRTTNQHHDGAAKDLHRPPAGLERAARGVRAVRKHLGARATVPSANSWAARSPRSRTRLAERPPLLLRAPVKPRQQALPLHSRP